MWRKGILKAVKLLRRSVVLRDRRDQCETIWGVGSWRYRRQVHVLLFPPGLLTFGIRITAMSLIAGSKAKTPARRESSLARASAAVSLPSQPDCITIVRAPLNGGIGGDATIAWHTKLSSSAAASTASRQAWRIASKRSCSLAMKKMSPPYMP